MRRAFTVVELLVVVVIVGILAALLFPVMQRAKSEAQDQSCQQNLRQFAVGLELYRTDHDGLGYLYLLPRPMQYPYNYYDGLAAYLKDGNVVWCPVHDGWEGPFVAHNLYKMQTLHGPPDASGGRVHHSLVPAPGQIVAYCTNHARGDLVTIRSPLGVTLGIEPKTGKGSYPGVREDTSIAKFRESDISVYAYDASGWVTDGTPSVIGSIFRFANEPWPPVKE